MKHCKRILALLLTVALLLSLLTIAVRAQTGAYSNNRAVRHTVCAALSAQVLMAYRRLTDCAMTFFSLPYAVTVPSRWQGTVTARRCENGVELFAVKPGRAPSSLCSVLFTKKETSGELFGRMYSNKDDSVVCDVVFVLSPLSVSEGSPMEALCAAMLAMRCELALYSHASYFVSVP